MKYLSILFLSLTILTLSPADASDRQSYKVKSKSLKHQMKAQAAYQEKQFHEEFSDPKRRRPIRITHRFSLTGKQFLLLIPFIVTLNAIPVSNAQETRSAYVDCDNKGHCYDPNVGKTVFVSEPPPDPSLQGCAPFVNPNKLPAEDISLGLWSHFLNQATPKVGKELDHHAVCSNHTAEERRLIVSSFNEKIAPKIAQFLSLARNTGKKAGIILGILQDKCASLYQQIQLFKLAKFFNIPQVLYPMNNENLFHALNSAAIYNTRQDLSIHPQFKATVNLAAMGYAIAFNFTYSAVDNKEGQENPNSKWVKDLIQLGINYKQHIFQKYSNDPREQRLALLKLPEIDKMIKSLGPCPDFFLPEKEFASDINRVRSDFILPLGEVSLSPLSKVLKSQTHIFLMIRPTRDLGEHIGGNIQIYAQPWCYPDCAPLVTQKCADQYDEYAKNFNERSARSYPCVIHPVVDEALMLK